MTEEKTCCETATEDNRPPKVAIIMGSKSDMPVMQACVNTLEAFNVPYEVKIISANRNPDELREWTVGLHERGTKIVIAAAGKAAHLGGVIAAHTCAPVITVPMKTSDLGGLDSLLSMVQMPSGVPVACVGINAAKNAAVLAVQMLGIGCEGAWKKMEAFKQSLADGTEFSLK